MKDYSNFKQISLEGNDSIFVGGLPPIITNQFIFEDIWSIHPEGFHEIWIHGRLVKTPRWQQAYEKDYNYTGNVNKALPLPKELVPFLAWVQATVDLHLNGVLINWYDGNLNHYIGKHRDSITGLKESPIVTMSFGQERIFRLRKYNSDNNIMVDIPVHHGSCIILPFQTNRNYAHEIVRSKKKIKKIKVKEYL